MRTLVVVHYHWRPGGVRVVALRGAGFLAEALGCGEILFLSGDSPPHDFQFKTKLPHTWESHASLGYSQDADPEDFLISVLGKLEKGSAIWAHNISLGRNPKLGRALARAAEAACAVLLLHHHDWWFDRRPERALAIKELSIPLDWLLPSGRRIRHAVLSRDEAAVLRKFAGDAVAWSANPLFSPDFPVSKMPNAHPPMWLMPCRALERKNILEGFFLTRILSPGAAFVVTGGAGSSERDAAYARTIREVPGITWNDDREPLAGLVARAECILVTSTQEGFGLPALEAMAWERPLILRRLSRITDDLESLGCNFAMTYSELLVDGRPFSKHGIEQQIQIVTRPPNISKIVMENPWIRDWQQVGLRLSSMPEIPMLRPENWAARLAALVNQPMEDGSFDAVAAQRALKQLLDADQH